MKKLLAAILTAALAFGCVTLFAGCSASIGYILNEDEDGNKYYTVYCSGYSAALDGELVIPSYYGEEEEGTYAPVTEIAAQAFANSGYTKVTIPSTITVIGNAAFAYCYKLQEVVFEDGIQLSSIPRGMFGYCSRLDNVILPDSVTSVGAMSFYYCESLSSVTLPEGLTEIGAEAFEACTSLSYITLPESLTTVGALAFYSSGLKEIVIPENVCDRVYETEDSSATEYGLGLGAFHSCQSLERAVVLGKIETLRSGVFGYCIAMTEIYLPETITCIEGAMYDSNGDFYCGHAFHSDSALEDVYFAGTEEQWNSIDIVTASVSSSGVTYDNSAVVNAEKHYAAILSLINMYDL